MSRTEYNSKEDGIHIDFIPKVVETISQIHSRLGQSDIQAQAEAGIRDDIRRQNIYCLKGYPNRYVELLKKTNKMVSYRGINIRTMCHTDEKAKSMRKDSFFTFYFKITMPKVR